MIYSVTLNSRILFLLVVTFATISVVTSVLSCINDKHMHPITLGVDIALLSGDTIHLRTPVNDTVRFVAPDLSGLGVDIGCSPIPLTSVESPDLSTQFMVLPVAVVSPELSNILQSDVSNLESGQYASDIGYMQTKLVATVQFVHVATGRLLGTIASSSQKPIEAIDTTTGDTTVSFSRPVLLPSTFPTTDGALCRDFPQQQEYEILWDLQSHTSLSPEVQNIMKQYALSNSTTNSTVSDQQEHTSFPLHSTTSPFLPFHFDARSRHPSASPQIIKDGSAEPLGAKDGSAADLWGYHSKIADAAIHHAQQTAQSSQFYPKRPKSVSILAAGDTSLGDLGPALLDIAGLAETSSNIWSSSGVDATQGQYAGSEDAAGTQGLSSLSGVMGQAQNATSDLLTSIPGLELDEGSSQFSQLRDGQNGMLAAQTRSQLNRNLETSPDIARLWSMFQGPTAATPSANSPTSDLSDKFVAPLPSALISLQSRPKSTMTNDTRALYNPCFGWVTSEIPRPRSSSLFGGSKTEDQASLDEFTPSADVITIRDAPQPLRPFQMHSKSPPNEMSDKSDQPSTGDHVQSRYYRHRSSFWAETDQSWWIELQSLPNHQLLHRLEATLQTNCSAIFQPDQTNHSLCTSPDLLSIPTRILRLAQTLDQNSQSFITSSCPYCSLQLSGCLLQISHFFNQTVTIDSLFTAHSQSHLNSQKNSTISLNQDVNGHHINQRYGICSNPKQILLIVTFALRYLTIPAETVNSAFMQQPLMCSQSSAQVNADTSSMTLPSTIQERLRQSLQRLFRFVLVPELTHVLSEQDQYTSTIDALYAEYQSHQLGRKRQPSTNTRSPPSTSRSSIGHQHPYHQTNDHRAHNTSAAITIGSIQQRHAMFRVDLHSNSADINSDSTHDQRSTRYPASSSHSGRTPRTTPTSKRQTELSWSDISLIEAIQPASKLLCVCQKLIHRFILDYLARSSGQTQLALPTLQDTIIADHQRVFGTFSGDLSHQKVSTRRFTKDLQAESNLTNSASDFHSVMDTGPSHRHSDIPLSNHQTHTVRSFQTAATPRIDQPCLLTINITSYAIHCQMQLSSAPTPVSLQNFQTFQNTAWKRDSSGRTIETFQSSSTQPSTAAASSHTAIWGVSPVPSRATSPGFESSQLSAHSSSANWVRESLVHFEYDLNYATLNTYPISMVQQTIRNFSIGDQATSSRTAKRVFMAFVLRFASAIIPVFTISFNNFPGLRISPIAAIYNALSPPINGIVNSLVPPPGFIPFNISNTMNPNTTLAPVALNVKLAFNYFIGRTVSEDHEVVGSLSMTCPGGAGALVSRSVLSVGRTTVPFVMSFSRTVYIPAGALGTTRGRTVEYLYNIAGMYEGANVKLIDYQVDLI